ncbi:hypothetical protein CF15_06860 [Pyrodictium occultum]|uniref:tRNAHis guanylyltransferase catalytic domain-containing protein n=1 Tax=Pyrodictium occultum TaxID=2309 RepID=A0A0V8RWK2_PYROC|nr:hypothetical protein CF15_06860 [Pyrodictium occultum]
MDRGLLERLLRLNPAALEEEYKAREIFQGERVEPPFALRLDGVGWGRRLQGFGWPRDERVHRALARAVAEALRLLGGCCALVVSDEASLVFTGEPPYSGRVEKLVSISSGVVSAGVSLSLGRPLFLDARVVKLYSGRDAARYLLHRARVGLNNYVSSIYHAASPRGAGRTPGLREMIGELRRRGRDPLEEPAWRLVGSCLVYAPSRRLVEPPGVVAERRRLLILDGGLEACLEALGAGEEL